MLFTRMTCYRNNEWKQYWIIIEDPSTLYFDLKSDKNYHKSTHVLFSGKWIPCNPKLTRIMLTVDNNLMVESDLQLNTIVQVLPNEVGYLFTHLKVLEHITFSLYEDLHLRDPWRVTYCFLCLLVGLWISFNVPSRLCNLMK
jgi:hypothetical protein